MKLPEVLPDAQPKFHISDYVWVIPGRNAQATSVKSIIFELHKVGHDQVPVLVCTGYRLNAFNFEDMSNVFTENEVYGTEAEAQKLAYWHTVTDVSEDEWKRAVGDRDQETFEIDECELSRCCAIISSIRDLLLECKKFNGLIERDRRRLRELLGKHEYPMPGGKRPPILDKIFGRLNLLGTTAPTE